MKRVLFVILTLALLCLAVIPAAADSLYNSGSRVLDHDDLLTAAEEKALEDKIKSVSDAHSGFDIIILTVSGTGSKTSKLFTADYFMDNGFGTGEGRDGLILMISAGRNTDIREFCSAAHGYGEAAVGAYFYECLFDDTDVVNKLSDNRFYEAFDEYLSVADSFLTAYDQGEPYSYSNSYSHLSIGGFFIISAFIIAIALAIGLIYAAALAKKMKTAIPAAYAGDYVCKDSMNLTRANDIYMYSVVKKTPRPKETSSGSNGGSFSSSGGSSFSGGSSRF